MIFLNQLQDSQKWSPSELLWKLSLLSVCTRIIRIEIVSYLHSATDYLVSNCEIFWNKFICSEVERYNSRENPDHCFITEGINGANIEVSQKARCDWVSSSSWWTHGSHQLYINKYNFICVF